MTLRHAAVLSCLVALSGCTAAPSDSRFTQTSLPDRASFPRVADLMVLRCGTLDCHGTPARNLRLYGSAGLRWKSTDRPLSPLCNTQDEIDQDYLSIVGLEPEIMDAVVASGGAQPERLTMIRKARGSESHKGGTLMAVGDDEDACLTSWLGGKADAARCTSAVTKLLPTAQGTPPNPFLGCIPPP